MARERPVFVIAPQTETFSCFYIFQKVEAGQIQWITVSNYRWQPSSHGGVWRLAAFTVQITNRGHRLDLTLLLRNVEWDVNHAGPSIDGRQNCIMCT